MALFGGVGGGGERTRISYLDSNDTTLKTVSVVSQGLLQALYMGKLGVGKALWSLFNAILDDANIGDFAGGEEIGYTLAGGFVGKVA